VSPMSAAQHTKHATHVDRDDPFLATRIDHHEVRTAVGRQIDYSKTRRIPAPIEDRFRLIQKGDK
jgi:hypothetical protein